MVKDLFKIYSYITAIFFINFCECFCGSCKGNDANYTTVELTMKKYKNDNPSSSSSEKYKRFRYVDGDKVFTQIFASGAGNNFYVIENVSNSSYDFLKDIVLFKKEDKNGAKGIVRYKAYYTSDHQELKNVTGGADGEIAVEFGSINLFCQEGDNNANFKLGVGAYETLISAKNEEKKDKKNNILMKKDNLYKEKEVSTKVDPDASAQKINVKLPKLDK